MTEQQVRDFLGQFGKAREEFDSWPKWMRDAARKAAATFPHSSGAVMVCSERDAACVEVPVGLRCKGCPAGVGGPLKENGNG